MRLIRVVIMGLLLVSVLISGVRAENVWAQDQNGSFYVLRKIKGVTHVVGYPMINNVAQKTSQFKAPRAVSVSVDPNGNVFTLREEKRGNRHIIKVYKNTQPYTVTGTPLEVDVGKWGTLYHDVTAKFGSKPGGSSRYRADLEVSQNNKNGDRVYVYTSHPSSQLHYLPQTGVQAPKIYRQSGGNIESLVVNAYSSKKDYVQLHNTDGYDLQALWSPLPGAQGTTGYLHRSSGNKVFRLSKPEGNPITQGVVAFNAKIDRSDAFADYVAAYNPNQGHGLSFMSANARGQAGNNTIYHMISDTALKDVQDKKKSWGLSWATLGTGASIRVHMAAPSIIEGKNLLVYEPIMKLNPNAMRRGEIKDSNGDNYDDYGYNRDDYVVMDVKTHSFPLSQASGRVKTFSYRSLDYVTGSATGPYMYFKVDGRRDGSRDEVGISVQNSGRTDSGNVVATEATKASFVKAEYYGVSGSNQNGFPAAPDKYDNEVGDIYTLRRTYGYYKNTSGQLLTLGGGTQTLTKERDTFYALFQDRDMTDHRFHIGTTKYQQKLYKRGCGCRGSYYGAFQEISSPQSPIMDLTVVNIGMPPHIQGDIITDIQSRDYLSEGNLLINEDGYYGAQYGGNWCFENWNGALGSNKDTDMDNRAGGLNQAVYSNKSNAYWGTNHPSRDPLNPVFFWKIRQLKPAQTGWILVNTGPEFKPGDKYIFRDGGKYQIKLDMECYMADWGSLNYPPFYWESSGTLENIKDMAAYAGARQDVITVVAKAKEPTPEPGDLKVAFYNVKNGSDYPSSYQHAAVDEDTNKITLYGSTGDDVMAVCIYQVDNGTGSPVKQARLSRTSDNPGSSKVVVAPPAIPDYWLLSGDVSHTNDKFSGIVYDSEHPPTLTLEITPAKTKDDMRFFSVNEEQFGKDAIDLAHTDCFEKSSAPHIFKKTWNLFLRDHSISGEVDRNGIVRVCSLISGDDVTVDWLTPYPDEDDSGYPPVVPRVNLCFKTPILPDFYTVTVRLKYWKRTWTPVYEGAAVIDYTQNITEKNSTALFKLVVNDTTAPIVQLTNGTDDIGNFKHTGTIGADTSRYTAVESFSGATTGDSFPRTDEISVAITDNNPNFGGDHMARILYADPKTKNWRYFDVVSTEKTIFTEAGLPVFDDQGNVITDDTNYTQGKFKSCTLFDIDMSGKNDFVMPGDKTETAYYVLGRDGADANNDGNGGMIVIDGRKVTVDSLEENISNEKTISRFDLEPEGKVDLTADPDGLPSATGDIDIWDNDPPDVLVEIGSGFGGTSKIRAITVKEPLDGTDDMQWFGGPAPALAGSGSGFQSGFHLTVEDESGSQIYPPPSQTGPETDYYYDRFPENPAMDVGENMEPFIVDISEFLEGKLEPPGTVFKIKVAEKVRFELKITAYDNTAGDGPIQLKFAEEKDGGELPSELEFGLNARVQHGSELIQTPYYWVFRAPSEVENDNLEIAVKDEFGNRRIVRIPFEVTDTRVTIHTLQTNASFGSGEVTVPADGGEESDSKEESEENAETEEDEGTGE